MLGKSRRVGRTAARASYDHARRMTTELADQGRNWRSQNIGLPLDRCRCLLQVAFHPGGKFHVLPPFSNYATSCSDSAAARANLSAPWTASPAGWMSHDLVCKASHDCTAAANPPTNANRGTSSAISLAARLSMWVAAVRISSIATGSSLWA